MLTFVKVFMYCGRIRNNSHPYMEIQNNLNSEVDSTKLNPRQESFCRFYTTDMESFGNGAASYLKAYNFNKSDSNNYKTACAAASRLLTNVKVITRIKKLLEKQGLNDEIVDSQLLFLIIQDHNLKAKINAIKEYNRLRGRITNKLQTTSAVYPIVIKSVPYKNV